MIVTGQNPPIVLVSRRVRYDPNGGYKVVAVWEGTEAEIWGAFANISSSLIKEVDDSSAPVFRLIVESPDISGGIGDSNSQPTLIYEMVSNPGQRSGYEHPQSLALPEIEIRRVKEAIGQGQKPSKFDQKIIRRKDDETTEQITNELYHANDFEYDQAETLYGLMVKGRDSYVDYTYAFRVTSIITPVALSIAMSNRLKVYPTASVLSEIVPPSEYSTAIQAVASSYPYSVSSGDNLGWLKLPAGFTKIAGDKLAVVIEYWFEAWADYYYHLLGT